MKGAATDYWVIRIGEIALGLSLVVAGFYLFTGFLHGSCWADTIQDLKLIQSEAASLDIGDSKNIFADFGTCTDSVIFDNRKEFNNLLANFGNDAENIFSCPPEEFKSVVAAVKKVENSPSLIDVGKAVFTSDKEIIERWVRSYAGLDHATHCLSLKCLDCTFTGKLSLQISEKSTNYCINIKKQSETEYSVKADIVESENKCI